MDKKSLVSALMITSVLSLMGCGPSEDKIAKFITENSPTCGYGEITKALGRPRTVQRPNVGSPGGYIYYGSYQIQFVDANNNYKFDEGDTVITGAATKY